MMSDFHKEVYCYLCTYFNGNLILSYINYLLQIVILNNTYYYYLITYFKTIYSNLLYYPISQFVRYHDRRHYFIHHNFVEKYLLRQ